MRLKVGVTGGIGSGKTSVCRIFSVLGIPVFSSDSVARTIMDSDRSVISMVNSLTGKNLYATGVLDRMELARLIFTDRELLAGINAAVHPIVLEKFIAWEKNMKAPYVILEAAILFESGAADLIDKILTVTAPVEERIDRVVKRNNLTREQVIERINNQSADDYMISHSDYVVNNADNEMIIPVIIDIHGELLIIADNT